MGHRIIPQYCCLKPSHLPCYSSKNKRNRDNSSCHLKTSFLPNTFLTEKITLETTKCSVSKASLKNTHCYNYSSFSPRLFTSKDKRPHYFVVYDTADWKRTDTDETSWNDAANLCQAAGGFLPVLRSRDELFHLILLVNHVKEIDTGKLAFAKIFVGLMKDFSVKRSMWQNRDPVAFELTSGDLYCHISFNCESLSCKNCREVKREETANTTHSSCYYLSTMNLANTSWEKVRCSHKMRVDVVCMIPWNLTSLSESESASTKCIFCEQEEILHNATCYLFLWNEMSSLSDKTTCYTGIQHFEYLFYAIAATKFPPIANFNLSFTSPQRLVNIINYPTAQRFSNESDEVFCIKEKRLASVIQGTHMFLCQQKIYISAQDVCDGTIDCVLGEPSDEDNSVCSTLERKKEIDQDKIHKIGDKSCGNLFLITPSGTCKVYGSLKSDSPIANSTFQCKNGTMTNESLFEDGILNCVADGLDELALVHSGHDYQCQDKYSIPCRESQNRCFNVSKICQYELNSVGSMGTCRNGEHLQECEVFQCNGMFKCPGYYCIPWSCLCDGKWDCPDGFDEVSKQDCKANCINLFRCKSFICIHLLKVCDKKVDCSQGEDELFCSMKYTVCLSQCTCLAFAIDCEDSNLISMTLWQFKLIYIRNATFGVDIKLQSKTTAFVCILSKITDLCRMLNQVKDLLHLDVASNQIVNVKSSCFKKAQKIKICGLSKNLLKELPSDVFSNLEALKVLNLSGNPIKFVDNKVFFGVTGIKLLSLNINENLKTDMDILESLNLNILENSAFEVCCLAPENAKCTTQVPWFGSCTDLLPNAAFKITFYCVSSLLLVINVVSIIMQRMAFKQGSDKSFAFGTMVILVNVADILHSVPLFVVWIADIFHGAKFPLSANDWKESFYCIVIFHLFLFCCCLSPTLLLVLAYSRLMVVMHPLDSKFKQTNHVVRVNGAVFSSAFLVASVVATLSMSIYSKVPFTICSPFQDPNNEQMLTVVIIIVRMLFLLAMVISILAAYTALIISLKESQKRVQASKSKKESNTSLLLQIVTLTASNLICWVPSSVIFTVGVFWQPYPTQMLMWIVIAADPINSLMDPVVFSVTALRKK